MEQQLADLPSPGVQDYIERVVTARLADAAREHAKLLERLTILEKTVEVIEDLMTKPEPNEPATGYPSLKRIVDTVADRMALFTYKDCEDELKAECKRRGVKLKDNYSGSLSASISQARTIEIATKVCGKAVYRKIERKLA